MALTNDKCKLVLFQLTGFRPPIYALEIKALNVLAAHDEELLTPIDCMLKSWAP